MNRTGAAFWMSMLVALVVGLSGCRDGASVRESDLETVDQLIDAGLAVDAPHVRAETIRTVATAGSPQLVDRIRSGLDDDHPMVRASAVHAFLAVDHPDADRVATAAYNDASVDERKAIVESVVDLGSSELQKSLVERSIRANQPDELRRLAFEKGLEPRLRRAAEQGESGRVQALALPKLYNDYTLKLDTVLGDDILALLVHLGEQERVDPLAEILGDSSEDLERRLRAARILADAGAERAIPAFSAIIESSKVDPDDQKLAIPQPRIDPRLVRSSVLGMVAAGQKNYVPRAKLHLEEADADRFVRVLEALAANPAEGARLAIENAMVDARPTVRRRAVELYGERDDASAEPLFDVLDRDHFRGGGDVVRSKVARLLASRFSNAWLSRLRNQLTSEEGVTPALARLDDVVSIPAGRDLVEKLDKELKTILDEGKPENARNAGFLLVKTGKVDRSETLRAMTGPKVRYAYLEHAVRESPQDHKRFFLDNLYSQKSAPELFVVRLMAGIGLWKASRDQPVANVLTPADVGAAPSTEQ